MLTRILTKSVFIAATCISMATAPALASNTLSTSKSESGCTTRNSDYGETVKKPNLPAKPIRKSGSKKKACRTCRILM